MKYLILSLLTALALLSPSSAQSQSTSLTLSPALLEFIVEPGKPVTTALTLTNRSQIPLPIKGFVTALTPHEAASAELSAAFDASSWFTLSPDALILQPGESRQIEVTIQSPTDTVPGGHYASLFFEPLLPEGAISQGSSPALARVGALAFLVVPGELDAQLEVTEFSLPRWQTWGPLTVDLTLRNSGNLHLTPQVTLTILDPLGRKQEVLTPPVITILPGTSRKFVVSGTQSFMLGPHLVRPLLVYGPESAQIELPVHTIWFIPWPLIFLLLIPLTSLVTFVIVKRRSLKLAWLILTNPKYD